MKIAVLDNYFPGEGVFWGSLMENFPSRTTTYSHFYIDPQICDFETQKVDF